MKTLSIFDTGNELVEEAQKLSDKAQKYLDLSKENDDNVMIYLALAGAYTNASGSCVI